MGLERRIGGYFSAEGLLWNMKFDFMCRLSNCTSCLCFFLSENELNTSYLRQLAAFPFPFYLRVPRIDRRCAVSDGFKVVLGPVLKVGYVEVKGADLIM
jgi:hypothetical protein